MHRIPFPYLLFSGPIGVWLVLGLFPLMAIRAAPDVGRGPAPNWVTDVAIPEDRGKFDMMASGGMAQLLLDTQRNEAEQTEYSHWARKFTSPSGVQNGTRVTIDFAPSYQTLVLNKLVIHRGSAVIDRLPEARVRLLDREQGMADHVYDGFVTASVEVEDVRVGDTLECAFSIRGENPIFNGTFSDFNTTSWSIPIARFSYRLLWPKKLYLGSRISGSGPKLDYRATELGDDLVEHRWTAENVPATYEDGDTPDWFFPYGRLQISGYRDWSDVVDWALGFYTNPATLPPSIEEEIDRLRRLDDPERQVVGALEYVQNNFRYLSESEGVHSHLPHPIEEVVARGFGDCKDKARLLTAMLRALGFDARPALVHSGFRQEVGSWLPSPTDFNHVIVTLSLNHRRYWLDATRDHQSGTLDERFCPSFGKALIIQPGEIGLTNVPLFGKKQAFVEEETELRMPAYDQPVQMRIVTTYTGREADRQRSLQAGASPSETAKSYLNFASQQYAGTTVKTAPTFEDRVQDNHLVSEETYTVSKFWQPRTGDSTRLYGEVYPYLIKNYLELPDSQTRSSPLRLAYPKKIREVFRFELPEFPNLSEESFAVDDPAFHYTSSTRIEGHLVTVTYEYESRAEFVPAEQVAEYLANVRKARDDLGYSISIPKSLAAGGASSSLPAGGALNWPILVLLVFFAIVVFAAAVVAYRWRPAWPPKPADPKYAGLQGWLFLVGLGLIARPILVIIGCKDLVHLFDINVWNSFTSPGQAYYHALWAPLLLAELFINVCVIAFSLLLIVLFFQRRRTFPKFFIGVVVFVAIFSGVDLVLGNFLAEKFPQLKMEGDGSDLRRAILQAVIWVPYMLVSQRVRATFIK